MAEAKYRQIAEDLERRILSGDFGGGGKLPTEIELREHYRSSRNTVHDAIRRLTMRGLIETKPGLGTFVVDKIEPFVNTLTTQDGGRAGDANTFYIEQVAAHRRRAEVSTPDVRKEIPSPAITRALGIASGDEVVSRRQKRIVDGHPWSRQTGYFPMSLVLRGASRLLIAEDIGEGSVAYLRETLGIEQVGYRDVIAMRTADAEETGYFRLPSDRRVPLFEITRVAFDQTGAAFRLAVTTYPADRNIFMIEIGDLPPAANGP